MRERERCQREQQQQADQMRQRRSATVVGDPLEQRIAEQIQRRAAEDRSDARILGMAGMHQYQLVGDRADHDAADDQHMQIGVRRTRHPAGIGAVGDTLEAALGACIEIDPPHRHRA